MIDPLVPLDSELASHAVEVAPRIWWVGAVLQDDPFQCHAYLIEAGDSSVLVDPGSTLTIDETLRKVREVLPLDSIRWIVLHHSDPDCADGLHRLSIVLTRDDVEVVTEWRSALLLRHFAARFPFVSVEDLGSRLELPEGRSLDFVLTPYLHFPGAFVTFAPDTETLLSADLFGGFNRANRLWARDVRDFEDLRQFHEHYMPSREILIAGLAAVRNQCPHITTLLPQHGYLIHEPLIAPMFDELAKLECGLMLLSRGDIHLARLLSVSAAVRRIGDAIEAATSLGDALDAVTAELVGVAPLRELWIETAGPDETILRFDTSANKGGATIEAWTTPHAGVTVLELRGGTGQPRVAVVMVTDDDWSPIREVGLMVSMVAGASRNLIAQAVASRGVEQLERELREQAQRDPLTGLLNRRALQQPGSSPGAEALMMIDIDHFKVVNDTYGHPVGDLVLAAVAEAVSSCLRTTDTAIRYGGEEILGIACFDTPALAEAGVVGLAERIRTSIASLDLRRFGLADPVTVSIGTAALAVGECRDDAVRRADAALYRAKELGRNRTCAAASPTPSTLG